MRSYSQKFFLARVFVAALVLLICAPHGFAIQLFRSKNQKLLDAASSGNIAQVQSLLAQGADIYAYDANGVGALEKAVQNGHAEIVKFLLNKWGKFGLYSALKFAVKNDNINIAKILLDYGVLKGEIDHGLIKREFAPITNFNHLMMIAALHDYKDMMNLLLGYGANFNFREYFRGADNNLHNNTPLYSAVRRDDLDEVRFLIEKGADVNFQHYSHNGSAPNTALDEAVKCGYVDEVKFLIKKGADVNATNSEGMSILERLMENRGTRCAKDIIAMGAGEAKRLYQAQINEGGPGGAKSLCKANYMKIAKLLVRYGADLNVKDQQGYGVASFVQSNTLATLKNIRVERRCFPNCFIRVDKTELKDVSGAVLTRLPRGAIVREESEDNGYAWVVVGKTLAGWVDASSLSSVKPDMFAPIIRVLSKSLNGAKLSIKGVVYSDKPLKSLHFGSKDIDRADFTAPKGNYNHSYPFKASMTMIPGAQAVFAAQDEGGLKAHLKVDVKTPVLDYTPQYAQLKVVRSASVFGAPNPSAKILTKVLNQSVIVSIGRKAGWYYLEGGGWIRDPDVIEMTQGPMSASPESVELNASPKVSAPKVLSAPSDVDVDVPFGVPNPNAIAVIVANRDYKSGVPSVEFALNDGRVMKKYFRRLFGVRESNLIYQKNAGKGDLEALFGTVDNYKGKLYNYVYGLKTKPDIFVYYVGHGAPAENEKAYLVPVDADPEYVALEGYPLDTLYANLRRLGARSVTVILDACFSGQSPGGSLIKNASSLVNRMSLPILPKGFSLLSAAGPNQMASWDAKEEHSLFTYYFLKGLKERAGYKTLPRMTMGEIKGYVRDRVEREARKLYNRDQIPRFDGSSQNVLANYAQH